VKQSANQYATPNPQYGYGIPDFQLAKDAALTKSEFSLLDFRIYPNPVSNVVNIVAPEEMIGSVFSLYTSLGQLVLEQKIESTNSNIALEPIAKGVYYYQINSLSQSKTGKIIKK
jgi:hypothetical protein